jgi:hypothetical protein
MKHTFIVDVHCDEVPQAVLVMMERMGYDEDYGFPYSVDWKWK